MMTRHDTPPNSPNPTPRPVRTRRGSRTRLVVAALAAILVVLVPSTATAIVYGEPDNGAHPNVGSFVSEYTDPATGGTVMVQLCTGTLIAADVVLGASHCFTDLPPEYGTAFFTLDAVIDANKDTLIDPTVTLLTGTPVTHPLYRITARSNTYDIAVFLLDDPVTGVTPAPVAPLGFFDNPNVRQLTYTAVGYGTVRETKRKGPQSLLIGWRREKANQHLMSVTKAWVTFSMNASTGNGGTCYGDSGGPHFVGSTVVSLTVTGDTMCKATDKTYRLDTPWAQEFLSQFVQIP